MNLKLFIKTVIRVSIMILIFSINVIAQTDTIYLPNEKISCNIKEITPDEVKYIYPNEEVPISIYKNSIIKIVFKSGRVMAFREATSFRVLLSAEEYDKVSFTEVQGEIKGLYKLEEVSSKAKGGSAISNMDKVKDRAYRKMKMEAALAGGNIVYLTQNITNGNQIGNGYQAAKTTETMVSGICYSNIVPDYYEFMKRIGQKREFSSFEVVDFPYIAWELSIETFVKKVKILDIKNENGLTYIKANIPEYEPESTFRLVYMNDEYFTLYNKDKRSVSNIRIKFQ